MSTAPVSHTNLPFPVENMQQWEQASADLERAITTYLHLSQSLEQITSTLAIDMPNLPARLDRQINHSHVSIIQLLNESFACVTRTRNRLVPLINRVPIEILGEAFQIALNSAGDNQPMGQAIIATYRCLYTILSVCSVWRKVGLAHKPLWALVPITDRHEPTRFRTEKSITLSLERAGKSGLHLAADILAIDLRRRPSVLDKLAELRPDFRSINLRASYRSIIEGILHPIVRGLSQGSLRELSLFLKTPASDSPTTHGNEICFENSPPAFLASFGQLLSSLRIIRMRRIAPPMANLCFSNLLELRIQAYAFRHNTALQDLLWSVSTATQLRKLELITIMVYNDPRCPTPSAEYEIPFLLPSLQTLFLQDVSSDALRTVFFAIKSGAHRTILSMSLSDASSSNISMLHPAIKFQTIDTLVLRGFGQMHSYFSSDRTTRVPAIFSISHPLTAICLDGIHLDQELLDALTWRQDLAYFTTNFPKFRRIYITRSMIDHIGDLSAFTDMLASHPLEELVLGGHFSVDRDSPRPYYPDNDDDERWRVEISSPDERTIQIKDWLRQNVTKCTFLGSTDEVGFLSTKSQLW